MFTRWAVAAVVAALVLGPGHSAAGPSVPPNGYTIGTEDIVDITVWNNTVISRTVPVRPDGMISLPLLDDVQAAGLTPKQLKADLTRRLAKYIASPEVSVVVREIHSLKVAVIGEVRRPGRYDMKSRTSILEAIALAGGFNDFARRTKLVIMRQEGTGTKRIPINYNRIVAEEDDNVILQPGDIVVVP